MILMHISRLFIVTGLKWMYEGNQYNLSSFKWRSMEGIIMYIKESRVCSEHTRLDIYFLFRLECGNNENLHLFCSEC